jgi:hypothetical protein
MMETPENVVDEDGGDEAWDPRPAAWSPSLSSFPPTTLVLAMNSSNLITHLVAALR